MPPAHVKLARAGELQLGMDKDEVIMALGYPPRRRTATIDHNTWIYYIDKLRTFRVIFQQKRQTHPQPLQQRLKRPEHPVPGKLCFLHS